MSALIAYTPSTGPAIITLVSDEDLRRLIEYKLPFVSKWPKTLNMFLGSNGNELGMSNRMIAEFHYFLLHLMSILSSELHKVPQIHPTDEVYLLNTVTILFHIVTTAHLSGDKISIVGVEDIVISDSLDMKGDYVGRAFVSDVFTKSGDTPIYMSGCKMTYGVGHFLDTVEVMRNNECVYQGPILKLVRFKDDITEVKASMEFGINIDFPTEEGDVIFFKTQEI